MLAADGAELRQATLGEIPCRDRESNVRKKAEKKFKFLFARLSQRTMGTQGYFKRKWMLLCSGKTLLGKQTWRLNKEYIFFVAQFQFPFFASSFQFQEFVSGTHHDACEI